MKKIKEFISKNKTKIIVVGSIIVGGVLIYVLINKKTGAVEQVFEQCDCKANIFDSLDKAVEQFKTFQETNKTVALFYENNMYSVLDLEKA